MRDDIPRVLPLRDFRPARPLELPLFLPHLGVEVPDRIRLCNCAGCGRELVSPLDRAWYGRLTVTDRKALPMVAGRVEDRPYCKACLAIATEE